MFPRAKTEALLILRTSTGVPVKQQDHDVCKSPNRINPFLQTTFTGSSSPPVLRYVNNDPYQLIRSSTPWHSPGDGHDRGVQLMEMGY